MKAGKFAVLLMVSSFSTALLAAPPADTGANALKVCASDNDPKNLCSWDQAAGAQGRTCNLDVERIDKNARCDYDHDAADWADHKPVCVSISRSEHILFSSSAGRKFRVRRLVRMNKHNLKGETCPPHPFKHHFEAANVQFGDSFDSQSVETSGVAPLGCRYKLEVQFDKVDSGSPTEPNDPQHRRLECRDPHLQVSR